MPRDPMENGAKQIHAEVETGFLATDLRSLNNGQILLG
jgi:hypothetical protein